MQSHEFVLGKIAEEADEVATAALAIAHAAHKALRFGPRSYHPDDPSKASNMDTMAISFERLLTEVNDLRAQLMTAAQLSHLSSTMNEEVYAQFTQLPADALSRQDVRRALRKTSRYLAQSVIDNIVPSAEGKLAHAAYAEALATVEEELVS